VSSSTIRSKSSRGLRAVIAGAACAASAATLSACSTGFGSPTRHATANLQAASVNIGKTLKVQDAIIALPEGNSSPKGGLAYLQFTAINLSEQPDQLIEVQVQPTLGADSAAAVAAASGAPASGAPASGAPASGAPAKVAASLQMATTRDVPKATGSGPGTARISVLLRDLIAPLSQGESVSVDLVFANSGSAVGVLVPVQSADAVGSAFLPSAPPPPPTSASASASALSSAPVSEPPSTPAGSAPGSAGAQSAPASSSASASAPASS
jgi:hypothetical protein